MEILVWPPGNLLWMGRHFRCALGRGGVSADKREGDGATPAGAFPLRRVMYRPDRLAAPATRLPQRALGPDHGWCDDPEDPAYNRPVRIPHGGRHERLWRDDGLYDIVVELGYNDDPVTPGLGSAIFLHCAGSGYPPTAGCVAVFRDDLLELLQDCDGDTVLRVSPSPWPANPAATPPGPARA